MSLPLDILSWFWVNQSLLFLLHAACLAEKQQIPIWRSLVSHERGSNPRSTALEASMLNHYATDAVYTNDVVQIRWSALQSSFQLLTQLNFFFKVSSWYILYLLFDSCLYITQDKQQKIILFKSTSNTYRIKGILFLILSLSGALSGEPDRMSQMMVLIKTVSKTNSPLFCLSVIYIQKSLKRWKKKFFADTEKFSGLNSIYIHAKTILFGDYFLAYFGLWSVIHSNPTRFIFSWTMNVTSFSPFLKFVHILWITRIIWKLIHLKLQ